MKTHYELLDVEPTAGADAIKTAFRREIARYHPDKVIHLGAEFQEIAATRAAALTVAYKTLTDPAQREEYDAGLAAGAPPDHTSPKPPPPDDIKQDAPTPPGQARFASERADRDVILRRAVVGRVRGIVETLYGKLETTAVRGFDLALVPIAKPLFIGAPPPRVLVKVVDLVDGAAITEAHGLASRARVHAGKSPVVVLLFARRIAPQEEISKANDATARQRRAPDAPAEVAVIAVDIDNWSCRLPPNCSAVVCKLTDLICTNR